MTKTYKKRKQKRGGSPKWKKICNVLEHEKNCSNDDKKERLKTCSDKERWNYIMYCCENGHTKTQMKEFATNINNLQTTAGLTRVKSRRRRSSRRRRRRPKRGRSAKR